LLELWVQIPSEAWMSFCCVCCVLWGRGLCDWLIIRPEYSYRLWCAWVWSWCLDNNGTLTHWDCCSMEEIFPLLLTDFITIFASLIISLSNFFQNRSLETRSVYIIVGKTVSFRNTCYNIMYLLTAIGWTPGGSSTVHIYT
jgi:hypothetical protein